MASLMVAHFESSTPENDSGSHAMSQLRDFESRPFVVPRHRADPPPGWCLDELRGDDATRREERRVPRALFLIRTEALGDVPEHLRVGGEFDLPERRQLARVNHALPRLNEVVDA